MKENRKKYQTSLYLIISLCITSSLYSMSPQKAARDLPAHLSAYQAGPTEALLANIIAEMGAIYTAYHASKPGIFTQWYQRFATNTGISDWNAIQRQLDAKRTATDIAHDLFTHKGATTAEAQRLIAEGEKADLADLAKLLEDIEKPGGHSGVSPAELAQLEAATKDRAMAFSDFHTLVTQGVLKNNDITGVGATHLFTEDKVKSKKITDIKDVGASLYGWISRLGGGAGYISGFNAKNVRDLLLKIYPVTGTHLFFVGDPVFKAGSTTTFDSNYLTKDASVTAALNGLTGQVLRTVNLVFKPNPDYNAGATVEARKKTRLKFLMDHRADDATAPDPADTTKGGLFPLLNAEIARLQGLAGGGAAAAKMGEIQANLMGGVAGLGYIGPLGVNAYGDISNTVKAVIEGVVKVKTDLGATEGGDINAIFNTGPNSIIGKIDALKLAAAGHAAAAPAAGGYTFDVTAYTETVNKVNETNVSLDEFRDKVSNSFNGMNAAAQKALFDRVLKAVKDVSDALSALGAAAGNDPTHPALAGSIVATAPFTP